VFGKYRKAFVSSPSTNNTRLISIWQFIKILNLWYCI